MSVYKSPEGQAQIGSFYQGLIADLPYAVTTRHIDTRHGRTFLIETGRSAGDTMLLLHGSASNSATWFGDMPLWGAGFKLVAADIPGHPGSRLIHDGWPGSVSGPAARAGSPPAGASAVTWKLRSVLRTEDGKASSAR